jgi:hypothetical protein
MSKKTGLIDKILNKTISRKLMAFLLASIFLAWGYLDSDNWTLLACIYIGAQGAIDFFQISKGMKPGTEQDQ